MSHAVHAVAERIGARAWGAAAFLAIVTLLLAANDEIRLAVGCGLATVFACGVTAGAHLVARKF